MCWSTACGSKWNFDFCYLISVVGQLVSCWKIKVHTKSEYRVFSISAFCCYCFCCNNFSVRSFKCNVKHCFSDLHIFLYRNIYVSVSDDTIRTFRNVCYLNTSSVYSNPFLSILSNIL